MPGPNGEACEKCYYWNGEPVDREGGPNSRITESCCVRYPPGKWSLTAPIIVQQLEVEDYDFDCWPSTRYDDWCGEYKPKE